MKKFILYTLAVLAVLAAIFTYILYTEGAFDTAPATTKMEPFMKCEAGKCAAGKCAAGKCAPGKCAGGK